MENEYHERCGDFKRKHKFFDALKNLTHVYAAVSAMSEVKLS